MRSTRTRWDDLGVEHEGAIEGIDRPEHGDDREAERLMESIAL